MQLPAYVYIGTCPGIYTEQVGIRLRPRRRGLSLTDWRQACTYTLSKLVKIYHQGSIAFLRGPRDRRPGQQVSPLAA